MPKRIKRLIRNMVCGPNVYQARRTGAQDLQAMLDRLHPVAGSRALVRLGLPGDGGYLVPDDLEGIEACFSPGVDQISGFEKECADRGMKVFLADHSVDGTPDTHGLFHFTQKYIGVTTNSTFMTLDDWVASSLPDSDGELMLQIDIEGFEYEVFLAASDQLMKRFRIIVAEFHQLDQVWNRPFFGLWSRVFDKLLQTHYCVHNHPNNYYGSLKHRGIEIPFLTEMTFHRRDRVERPTFARTFPHPLDNDNTDNPPLPLPPCWYAGDNADLRERELAAAADSPTEK
ncbi:MAG: FkbM family methyltransferase [Planctomycetota bacterium]